MSRQTFTFWGCEIVLIFLAINTFMGLPIVGPALTVGLVIASLGLALTSLTAIAAQNKIIKNKSIAVKQP